ncbi:predicted protein [Chaetomium globosum CBS 148.51]|uniref:Uncharacterized protein n=1 Tax=Chaetomium globosum (strain ATCC 6205 / CBS 148.51 / DSM 1962 / NBRC 6347 / NRRL 1970) TaxID=306901 RepID=Q2GNU8_CHAGB|nr:uncharacterized protein CHGG_10356 [Chaetomium globosum CBS 148.51]EAQ83952.1 predicted protein [Chaetomium globosum CBS 148.51]
MVKIELAEHTQPPLTNTAVGARMSGETAFQGGTEPQHGTGGCWFCAVTQRPRYGSREYVDSMTSSGPTQSTGRRGGDGRAIRDRDSGKKPSDEPGDRLDRALSKRAGVRVSHCWLFYDPR